jgi:hypothetical protein
VRNGISRVDVTRVELAPAAPVEVTVPLNHRVHEIVATRIFECLDIFHNRQRRYSALGMLTPVEFETRHQPATVA